MARLTAEQRKALDALPEKRRAFVLAYIGEAAGNATDAARSAGYAAPGEEGYRLLKMAQVGAAIEAMRAPAENTKIASAEERREFLTAVLRGDVLGPEGEPLDIEMKDRLKATELLGKMAGDFIERREISGPGGGPQEHGFRAILLRPEVAHELAHEPPRRRLAADVVDAVDAVIEEEEKSDG